MKGIQTKYFDLAELLRDILLESDTYSSVPDKIPQNIISKTARDLQEAFESGEEAPDEQNRLYNIYLTEKYGGLIYQHLDAKLRKQKISDAVSYIYEDFKLAIKKFGVDVLEDRGAKEILDLNEICSKLPSLDFPEDTMRVLEKLEKKKYGDILVQDIVCNLDSYPEYFWEGLYDANKELMERYY
jgi:hypothetical protein